MSVVVITPLDGDPSADDVTGVHGVLAAASATDHPGDPLPPVEEVAGRLRTRRERPDVGELLTGNSATNTHMLAINDRLGFRPHSAMLGFQGDAAALLATLRPSVPAAP